MHTHPHVASDKLDPKIVRRLSELKPWVSMGYLVLDYISIFAAIILCNMYWHPLLYIVCVMWIGARQHAIGILLHEASHFRMLKNKKANDLVGELFLAFPLFVSVQRYRMSHLAHHRHMNTKFDPDWVSKETPDWVFPKSRWAMFVMLLKILLGANMFWMIRLIVNGGVSEAATNKKKSSRAFVIGRITYYITLAGILTYFGWWMEFLLFWIIPLMTWMQFIFRIRAIAEHFGIESDDQLYTGARTTYPYWLEKVFLVSHKAWYHLEHHAYPSVPFFNLDKLHIELNKIPTFREQAHITRGYWGVLKECTAHL